MNDCETVGNNRRDNLKRYGTVSKWVPHDGLAKVDWGHLFLAGTPRCPEILIDEKLTLLVEDPRVFYEVSTRENIVECADFWENEAYVSQLVSLMHTGVGEIKPCEKERAMGGIFISYRREDSAGWTGRLAEYLKKQFGAESIFMDIDTIQPSIDFTEALQKAVSSCEVLLAMIGPEWATVTGKSGKPRIEDPSDWVRTEIAAALKRKIRVIPVLVGGAYVPTTDLLPDDLDALAQRQAHELTDKRWSFDCRTAHQHSSGSTSKTFACPQWGALAIQTCHARDAHSCDSDKHGDCSHIDQSFCSSHG